MSENNRKEFAQIIQAVSANHERAFDRTTDIYVNRISKRFKLDKNEVRDYLKLNTDLGQGESGSPLKATHRWNPETGQVEVIQ